MPIHNDSRLYLGIEEHGQRSWGVSRWIRRCWLRRRAKVRRAEPDGLNKVDPRTTVNTEAKNISELRNMISTFDGSGE